MKKLLSLLSSTTLVVSTTLSIVACDNGNENKNVVFMLDQGRASQTVVNAYKEVVDDFNENHNSSDVKVSIETPEAGQVMNSILANEPLPDMYITYADYLAKYKSFVPEEVVDVKKEGYLPDETIFKPYQNSFLDEGILGDGMYVLPVLKSFDVTTVNLRLLKEMVDIFKDSPVDYSANGVFSKNELGLKNDKGEDFKIESSDLFVNDQNITTQNKELYNSIAKADSAVALRKILQLDSNVLQLATDFKALNTYNSQNEKNEYAKAFALGIDSIDNKVYANYSNNLKEERIKVTAENKKFLYNYYNDQLYVNNTSGSGSVKKTVDWLEKLRLLENDQKSTGSLNSDVSNLDKTGTLFVANWDTGNKVNAFSYFAQGSMLMASGSSASSFSYITTESDLKDGKVKESVAVSPTDLFVLANSTTKGDSHIMQQGAGFGVFKSSNEEKTKVTKEFTHFLMNKDNMAKLAIWTGYMPSNELSYTGTDYFKWIKGEAEVENFLDGKNYDRQNLIIAQIVSLLADTENNDFNTVESAEPGGSIRDKVFKNQMQVGLYKSNSTLTMDKFWKGESTNDVSYIGAAAEFNSIAKDLDPLKSVNYETPITKNKVFLHKRED